MIHAARRIEKSEKSRASFQVGDIARLPVEAASIMIEGENKWLTLIQNASK